MGKINGAKPKTYPAAMVESITRLYLAGGTQAEVASALGLSQKVVWSAMKRHGVPARVAAKREQRGERNASWKGNSATYAALHLRVQTKRGTPSLCEHCGTTSAKRFEWASVSGRYEDPSDYVRLCCSCHHKMDGHVRNLGTFAHKKGGATC